MGEENKGWLTSAEVRKDLRISTCDLAHLREDGAIGAVKIGNAYRYSPSDVAKLRSRRAGQGGEYCRLDAKG
jgi:hypothetical protein